MSILALEKLLSNSSYPQKTILEKLVCHYCDLKKEDLFTQLDHEISTERLTMIKNWYHAYTVDKKPLEYIIWSVKFTWISFKVNPKTLIPRPETEYMIEAVNEHITNHSSNDFHILDVWTWCWVLGQAVYYHNQDSISQVLLTELDNETLEVAKSNAKSLFPSDAPISFLEASLLDHDNITSFLSHSPSILVANLPYIPEQLFDDNTDVWIKKREPKMAFVWGEDGCDLYRVMFDQLLKAISSWGNEAMSKDLTLFLEMMTRQVDVLRKEYPQLEFEEVKTFHFNIRIVKATIKHNKS